MDEQALVTAIAAADTACFERLYSIYERRVFQYLRMLVRDASTAEELVVDTMLAVWNGAHRFNATSRVSTWIFGIARHKAIDALRRKRPDGSAVSLEEAAPIPADQPGPEASAQQRSLQATMERAFRGLSAEHREILYLAFYADLPYQEIAGLLSLPLNTVKTRVYYAKSKLKSELERHTPSSDRSVLDPAL